MNTDAGRTWIKYPKNPVLGHIAHENRDPKVSWYEPEKKWVMVLYLEKNDFAFFSSPDLKQWTQLQKMEIPGCDEHRRRTHVDQEPEESGPRPYCPRPSLP